MHKRRLPWLMAAAVLFGAPLVSAQQGNSATSAEVANESIDSSVDGAPDESSDDTGDEARDESADGTADEAGAESDTGEERQPIPDDAELGIMRRSIVIVDDTQAAASERLGAFMGVVDGFFSRAGSNDEVETNGSWARIRVEGIRDDGESFRLKTSVKIRAVFPNTERKLKLLVSTEDDENPERSDVQRVPDGTDETGSVALRFIRSVREIGDVNFDIGVRRRDSSVQIFGRFDTRFTLDLNHNWSGRVQNSYRFFSKSGFENRLSLDFRRLFFDTEHIHFRTFTDFFWERDFDGALISNTSGLYWQFGSTRSLALEGLTSYNTELNGDATERFNGYELRVRWRHNIWRPWFFYEVWPSISWPSSRQFRRTEGILVRVEVFIGKKS